MITQRTTVTGWGRTMPAITSLARPDLLDSVAEIVANTDRLAPRGLGRAYGDAAQLAGGTTLDLSALDRILDFDPKTGIIDVEAGVSIDHLIRVMTPQGWFVPVTPGTRYVTVGGAIASDIHGKNHHSAGTFGMHVTALQLIKADGQAVWLNPTDNHDEFWATVGGMGMTGVVVRAQVKMRPIETARIKAQIHKVPNLDALMTRMLELDPVYPYSVAWIDAVTTGKSFGRGLISVGDHATREDLAVGSDPGNVAIPRTINFPIDVPNGLVNKYSVRLLSEAWYRKVLGQPADHLETFSDFFHPLDMIGEWNRAYGSAGFLQYQIAVPDEAADLVGKTIRTIYGAGGASFVNVLKRFGERSPGFISFPTRGWTLTLDVAANNPRLIKVLDALDEQVAAVGGRVYLTKDSRMRAEMLPKMYPQLDKWRAVRNSMDPNRKFNSDMARRLGLLGSVD